MGFLRDIPAEKKIQRLIPTDNGGITPFNVSSFILTTPGGDSYSLIRVETVPEENIKSPFLKEFPRLLNSLSDAVCAISMKGEILQANPSFYRLLEFGENERLLSNIRDVYVYPEDLTEKIELLDNQGYISTKEYLLITKTGRCRQFSDTSWVIRDELDNVTGYICLLKDITKLRNLESRLLIAEKNHGQLFDSLLVSIILVDPNGKVLNLNSAAREMYGFAWDEVSGESYDRIFTSDLDAPPFSSLISELVDKELYVKEEVSRKRNDGTSFFTQTFCQKVYDISEEVVAYTIMEKDLTERIRLERELKQSLVEIKQTQSAAILGFAKLTEFRDKSTGKHLERIREYTRVIANFLKESPKYSEYINDEYIENLCLSSSLHDIGKVGIEDKILLKPGLLEKLEYEEIKNHTLLGGAALGELDEQIDQRSFLTMGKEIASYHHERWDGNGYPEGRREEEIPLSARIVAIADVYDALTSKRSYKEAMSHEEAFKVIREERGKQFDPHLVDLFVENHLVFDRIKTSIELENTDKNINTLVEF
ncbi:MAG: PAS domain S-box protein [Spirochaetales bacterium]|nr:PAS domain S-box protein [Spirochaetales bacterium]